MFTVQPLEPGLRVVLTRSRRRMSLRVSQPLWPPSTVTSSVQAGPNWSRLYPVFGARPFTGSRASAAIAGFGRTVPVTGAFVVRDVLVVWLVVAAVGRVVAVDLVVGAFRAPDLGGRLLVVTGGGATVTRLPLALERVVGAPAAIDEVAVAGLIASAVGPLPAVLPRMVVALAAVPAVFSTEESLKIAPDGD